MVYSKTVNRGIEKSFLNYWVCVVIVVIVVVFLECSENCIRRTTTGPSLVTIDFCDYQISHVNLL